MLSIKYENSFKKDYKKAIARNNCKQELLECIQILANEKVLPQNYFDHELKGKWKGFRECHIRGDWLLIYRYQVIDDIKTLCIVRLGTHSDLFD